MQTPQIETRVAVINCAATAAQTLPEVAVAILAAEYQNQNAVAGAVLPDSALVIVTAAPNAGQLQFTGTSAVPSATVTLNAAAVVNVPLFVRYIPLGALPGAA